MTNNISDKNINLNNKICLILLRKDELLIRNKKFEKLHPGIQGILKTLALNTNIKSINLGVIKKKEE